MMQDALLVAKGLALREKHDEVRREEFFGALVFFTIEGRPPVVRKILAQQREILGDPGGIEALAPSLSSIMDEARRAAPLPLAEDLQTLLKQLRMNAVSLALKPLTGESSPPQPPALAEVERVRRVLRSGMLGQEQAITAMVRYLALHEHAGKGPKGVFILAGPPASGKSLAASLLAQGLGPDYHVWSYDCSNISSVHERAVFDGSPTNISGAQPGEMTSFVRQHPKAVVVLEHFDRMHPAVQAFLLPLLESGFIRDMHGFYEHFDARDMSNSRKLAEPEVDFREACLVITCEAGADLYESPALVERLRAEGGEDQLRTALINSLAAARNELSHPPGPCFSPPVLSRLTAGGAMVLLQPLGWSPLLRICRDELAAAQQQLRRKMDNLARVHIAQSMLDSLIPLLVLAGGGQADPRRLGRARLMETLFGPLYDGWIAGHRVGGTIEIRLAPADADAVAALVGDLGEDPVRALFRSRQRLVYDIAIEDEGDGGGTTILWCRAPRLVKVSDGADHQGPGALLVESPEMTLEQVAGQEVVKEKLRRQVSLMRDASALARRGLRPPGGCLLHGPPGTGKTTLARAFAGEAGLPFLAVTGPQLLDLAFQRKIFERLRKYAPAVLFVDELDALGRRGGGADPAINNLLAEIDGFSGRTGEPIFVIGATNLRDKIDPALLRPGRLEFSFAVNAPDRAARRFLLARVQDCLVDGVTEALIDYSSGMSGAQIEAACREMRLAGGSLDEQQARMLLEEVVFGEPMDLPDDLRRAIAYHEAGHAVAAVRGECPRVDYVSLTAREGNAGHVWSSGDIGRFTADKARAVIVTALAGRVAQHLFAGDIGGGADSGDAADVHKATRLAHHAVGLLGLDPVVGAMALPRKDDDFTLPGLERQVEEQMRVWLAEAEQAARALLREHWPEVEAVAAELLARGALAHDRLLAVMNGAGQQARHSANTRIQARR